MNRQNENRQITQKWNAVVIGGGLSGVAAAVAAAREGLSVLLIEKNGSLGGAVGNCLINPFMNYKISVQKPDGTTEKEILNRGLFLEILNRLTRLGGRRVERVFRDKSGVFNEEYVKFIAETLCIENNVCFLYQTILTGVRVDEGVVRSVTVYNKNGFTDIAADYFVDASGDAILSHLAGVPCRLGRNGDGLCQPMTLCFRLANVDMNLFVKEHELINPLYARFRAENKITNPRENVLIFRHVAPGILHFNTTRVIKKNPVDTAQLTEAQVEARRQVFEMYDFLTENFDCFKDAVLLMTAAEIGIRESRKIVGEYTICKEDILSYTIFDDSIACGAYEIDIHSPDGTGTQLHYLDADKYYTIPYRSLIPTTLKNVLVAGRCISSTHEAQSAYRVLPIVCNIGEAAGTAVAVAYKTSAADVRNADITAIQALLAANGARYR